MDTETHPDPFQEATSHGVQRAVQVASCAVTAAQVYIHQQKAQARAAAERDEQARHVLTAQIRADRDAARARWTPALNPEWLRRADLPQTCRAWGAAMPYADRGVPWYTPVAATAMRKCEERLRDLHPHAMARYDRLRADGMSPPEAMREAAPLFARPSRVHDAPHTPRPVLEASDGADLAPAAEPPVLSPDEASSAARAQAQEQRGRDILAALQVRARDQGRDSLGEAEQRTVLETITSLPPEVIDRVVTPDTTPGLARTLLTRAGSAEGDRAADLDAAASATAAPRPGERSRELAGARNAAGTADAATARAARTARTARPWEHDFPMPIQAVVASADPGVAAGPPAATVNAAARRPARGDRPAP